MIYVLDPSPRGNTLRPNGREHDRNEATCTTTTSSQEQPKLDHRAVEDDVTQCVNLPAAALLTTARRQE